MGYVFEELKVGLKPEVKFSQPSCCAHDLEGQCFHLFVDHWL